MRRAVVPLVGPGHAVVGELVAHRCPGLAAVVGALDQLAEPARWTATRRCGSGPRASPSSGRSPIPQSTVRRSSSGRASHRRSAQMLPCACRPEDVPGPWNLSLCDPSYSRRGEGNGTRYQVSPAPRKPASAIGRDLRVAPRSTVENSAFHLPTIFGVESFQPTTGNQQLPAPIRASRPNTR